MNLEIGTSSDETIETHENNRLLCNKNVVS